MKCNVVSVENESLSINEKVFTNDLVTQKNVIWIDILVSSRKELIDYLNEQNFSKELVNRLANPGQSFRLEQIQSYALVDCNISYAHKHTSPSYLTFLVINKKLVTLSSKQHEQEAVIEPPSIINHIKTFSYQSVFLAIFAHLVDFNAKITKTLTQKVDKALKASIGKNRPMKMHKEEQLYKEVIDLTEVFADQLTTMRLLPLDSDDPKKILNNYLLSIVKSMEHLVSSMERSIDKLDHIFQRHQSKLQEKGNARLSTLTIIQSVFVPLTFIAGVYGMNFIHMPELSWVYGYYLVLGFMLFVGITSLYILFKKGWFKSE